MKKRIKNIKLIYVLHWNTKKRKFNINKFFLLNLKIIKKQEDFKYTKEYENI